VSRQLKPVEWEAKYLRSRESLRDTLHQHAIAIGSIMVWLRIR